MKIKGEYLIIYANGISQNKYLISTEDYNEVVKPLDKVVGHLQLFKGTEGSVKEIKKTIKGLFGEEYFTDSSPLFDAIKSGYLDLPVSQGGRTKCKVKRL